MGNATMKSEKGMKGRHCGGGGRGESGQDSCTSEIRGIRAVRAG